jgi:hypothetical protein
MPHSWVRVSSTSSPKIRQCRGKTRAEFETCVKNIVEVRGGTFEELYFEVNGRWARVKFKWADHYQKAMIVYDLEGTDVIDVLTTAEADELERRIAEADAPESV